RPARRRRHREHRAGRPAGARRARPGHQPRRPRRAPARRPRAAGRDRGHRGGLDRASARDRARGRSRGAGRLPALRDRGAHRPGPLRAAGDRPPRRARRPPGAPGALGTAHPRRRRDHLRRLDQPGRDPHRPAPARAPACLRARTLARRPARRRAARPRPPRTAAGGGRGPRGAAARPRGRGVRDPVRPLNVPALVLILVIGAGFGLQMLETFASGGHTLVLSAVLLTFGLPLRRYMLESEERRERPSLAPRRHQIDLPTAYRTVLLARACAYTGAVVGGIFTGQALFLILSGTGDPWRGIL